jgi:exopolysaccharide biosynthesis polyprenyl glycosylphosphotransferase
VEKSAAFTAAQFSSSSEQRYTFPPRTAEPRLKEKLAAARPVRLLPEKYFLEQVRREQLRTFRTGRHLAIAVLSLPRNRHEAMVDLYNLSKIATILVRETDIVGWYGDNAIAVLITDTDAGGAEECFKRIADRTRNLGVQCEIVSIPEHKTDTDVVRRPDVPDLLHYSTNESPAHSRSALVLKRGLDILGAILGIVLFSPVMLLAAFAVKTTSPGSVVYKQIRLGHHGAPFVFYKFRSMRVDTDSDSHRNFVHRFIRGDSPEPHQGSAQTPFFKIKQDPRVTPVGRFLRKSSIDELPQLFNVLRGDMSLVGPRPPIPYEVEAYSSWHLRRILDVKPGLTGLWQVEGRSAVSFDEMVRLDLQYARNWSILLDLKIILKTVKVVLQCRGSA